MNPLQTFQVFPDIPKPLSFLETLARNIWWSWQRDAVELFRRINPRLWEESGQNPLKFLTQVPQRRLEELARDVSFLTHQGQVRESFEKAVAMKERPEREKRDLIGYFSMEFGIHESLPLFAGGLGVLAGDHLKSASDLDLPLVGIGLLYRDGYFHQFLDTHGWQQEAYPETDLFTLPVKRAWDSSGNVLNVTVDGPEGEIRATVWKISVGRIPLYLLDTNLMENPPHIREITARLYAGPPRIRLAQEVLLGIGGMKALSQMGIFPTVIHMNEGHSAFAGLERLAQTIERFHIDLEAALEIVPRTTVFTTHTPVAAGHDEFPAESVLPYLHSFQERLGTTTDEILSWGQPVGAGPSGPLSMFILGLRMAEHLNGVSRLHGKVARRMWSHVWPGRPEDEVPISHITNGIHIPTWISSENIQLFDRYLGPEWLSNPTPEVLERIENIYDEELWRAHEMNRSRLIRTCRELMVRQYARRNAPKAMMEEATTVLEQEILTIVFARRFATYKRANLLLQDPDRLESILSSKSRPAQIIFAGKAHPKDNEGKELIKRVIQFARKPSLRHRVIFLEGYDLYMTRHLVQGADVWLNTPRRPFEACGTSGMKAAANGVLNVSTLDGWWEEGFSEDRGWRIGNGEEYTDPAYQDAVESQALYNILENDVIPCFYERSNGDLPSRWLKMMKASMKMAMGDYCAQLMVRTYDEKYYRKAAERLRELTSDGASKAARLSARQKRLTSLWKGIRVEQPVKEVERVFRVGEAVRLTTVAYLGALSPEEVEVELYYGILKSIDTLAESHSEKMRMVEERAPGEFVYGCTIDCRASGRYGFTARVTPRGDSRLRFTPGLITWA